MKKIITIAVIAAILASCKTHDKKDVNYKVNSATSKAEWKGSAPDHFHVGSFKVTGALTVAANGDVKTGDFIIPIASMQDFDLPANVKPVLLADLKDNFFKIALHPEAKFHLAAAVPYTQPGANSRDSVNYMLTGDFTLAGQTHPITFPARITASGDSLLSEAKFNLDRNKWGITNYNDPSKKLYILPDVNIHLKVSLAKANPVVSPLAFLGI